MKRDNQILVRLSQNEKDGFEAAAKLSGISTSAWARQKLRAAAIRELREADMTIPFLNEVVPSDE